MELLHNLSDDQTALLGCFVALTGAGLLMSLSYYLGKWTRTSPVVVRRLRQSEDERDRPSKAA